MELVEPLMTIREIADYLRIHEMTIYKWAKKKKLPLFKVGGRWRCRRSDIDKYLTGGVK